MNSKTEYLIPLTEMELTALNIALTFGIEGMNKRNDGDLISPFMKNLQIKLKHLKTEMDTDYWDNTPNSDTI